MELTESFSRYRHAMACSACASRGALSPYWYLAAMGLLWLLCGLWLPVHAKEPVSDLGLERPGALSLAGPLWASPPGAGLPDAKAALALYRSGGFQALQGNLARGYTRDVIWLAAELPSVAGRASEMVLKVGPAYLDRVTAYQTQPDGSLKSLGMAGDQVPPAERALPALDAAFPLTVSPGQASAVLLRIETVSTKAAMVSLHSSGDYERARVAEGLLLGSIFTVSLLMILLALGMWLLDRQGSFLLWAANVASTTGLWLLLDGVASVLLPADQLHWANTAAGLFNLVCLVVGTLFMRANFEVRSLSAPLYRLLGAGTLILPLLMVATLLAGEQTPGPMLLVASLPLYVLLTVAIAWQMVRRNRAGLIYGPAALLYLGTSLHNILAVLGWVAFDRLSFYGWQVAGFFNLLSLQAAVLAQVHRSRKLHMQERQQLLSELSARNAELEQRVTARTQTLEKGLLAMQRAEAEQRELLSMASHEFRTPAAIIKASLDSLDLLQDQTPSEVRTRLTNIRAASQRMIRLADDAITDDRLKQERLPVRGVVKDLRVVLQDVARNYPEPDLTRWQLSEQAAMVYIDASMVSIALTNLVDNALRYHPEGNTPVLITLSLQPSDAPQYACVEVSDQGRGVPDETKATIFERFSVAQLDAKDEPTRKSVSGGRSGRSHGLGLNIARRIARAHGGDVSVRDNHPQGCVFTLSLSLQAAQPRR